jgi:hypothetical protein
MLLLPPDEHAGSSVLSIQFKDDASIRQRERRHVSFLKKTRVAFITNNIETQIMASETAPVQQQHLDIKGCGWMDPRIELRSYR